MSRIEKNSIVIQPRDLAVLRGLFESRIMTSAHAATLFFEGRTEAAKKRLQKLKAENLIAERPRRPYEPAILTLTSHGLAKLRSAGVLASYPKLDATMLRRRSQVSAATIAHELAVMDVKAAFVTHTRRSEKIALNEFSTWPRLHSFMVPSPRGHVEVKPDGFISIHGDATSGDHADHRFFFELDRSTESLGSLVAKARAYHRHSRHKHSRQGGMLFVFESEARRNNFLETLIAAIPNAGTLFLASTRADVVRDPLGPVWLSPIAYRRAVVAAVRNGGVMTPARRDALVRASAHLRSIPSDPDQAAAGRPVHKKATSEEVA